ncbi:hypothetical protein [Streptomyces sp. CA-251247]|uniref:hypothetical protein n=1 Tax=Streptomyces sp. CA-251247 TaxID=3240062 RepID=UPI003D8AC659
MSAPPELSRLIALCPPPAAPPPRVERGLIPVPSAHTELLAVYGVGCFDDFLSIYGNGVGNTYLDISDSTVRSTKILAGKEITELRAQLDTFGARPEDLIQWGGTTNADWLFWIPIGEPGVWPTVIVEAGQLAFAVLHRSSPGVLLDVLSRTWSTPIFPDDFPDDCPAFEPYRA